MFFVRCGDGVFPFTKANVVAAWTNESLSASSVSAREAAAEVVASDDPANAVFLTAHFVADGSFRAFLRGDSFLVAAAELTLVALEES